MALLSGEMMVEQRAAVIERFREGKEKVLVTTNVCARGRKQRNGAREGCKQHFLRYHRLRRKNLHPQVLQSGEIGVLTPCTCGQTQDSLLASCCLRWNSPSCENVAPSLPRAADLQGLQ